MVVPLQIVSGSIIDCNQPMATAGLLQIGGREEPPFELLCEKFTEVLTVLKRTTAEKTALEERLRTLTMDGNRGDLELEDNTNGRRELEELKVERDGLEKDRYKHHQTHVLKRS